MRHLAQQWRRAARAPEFGPFGPPDVPYFGEAAHPKGYPVFTGLDTPGALWLVPLGRMKPRHGLDHGDEGWDVDELVESMREHGQIQSIDYDPFDDVIINGHHRYEAAKRLGWTHLMAEATGNWEMEKRWGDLKRQQRRQAARREAAWKCQGFPGCYFQHEDKQRVLDHVERVHGYAGRLRVTRARSTGTEVGIYLADEAQIESDHRYVVVCEDHGGMMSVPTLGGAKSWAAHPEEWCEDCRDEVEGPS